MSNVKLRKVSEIDGCYGCPLRAKFPDNTFVGVSGLDNPFASRLVVAEAPGKQEQAEGQPLVGGAGNVFNALCSKAGIARNTLVLANTLSCRPPENRYPTSPEARSYCTLDEGKKAVAQCYQKHLRPVLLSRQWRRIDILGDHALQVLTGKQGINRWRGSILAPTDYPKEVAIPTLHPAYVMRDWNSASIVVSDLKKSTIKPPQAYNLYPSLPMVEALKAETLFLDIETNRFTQEITLVGVSDRPYTATVVPFKGPYKEQIKRLLLEAKQIVTQNGVQFDIPILCKNLDLEW